MASLMLRPGGWEIGNQAPFARVMALGDKWSGGIPTRAACVKGPSIRFRAHSFSRYARTTSGCSRRMLRGADCSGAGRRRPIRKLSLRPLRRKRTKALSGRCNASSHALGSSGVYVGRRAGMTCCTVSRQRSRHSRSAV